MRQGLKKWAFCSPLLLAISLLAIAQGASSDISISLTDLHAAQLEASKLALPSAQQISNTLVHIDTHQSNTTWTDPGAGITSAQLDNAIDLAEGRAVLIQAAAAGKKSNMEQPGVADKFGNDIPQAAAQSLGIKQLTGVDQDISNMRTGESNLQSASRTSADAAADAQANSNEATDELNNEASVGDSADGLIAEGEQILSNDPLAGEGGEGGAADEAATDATEAGEMG